MARTEVEESPNAARLQQELGVRVYTEVERVRELALGRMGVSASSLMPGVDYDTVFSPTNPKLWNVTVGNRWQMRVNNRDTRLVEVSRKISGLQLARFFQPDGSTWVQADSSQGEPWYEAPVSSDILVKTLDCLALPSDESCNVSVNFTAFKPSDFETPQE